MEEDKQEQPQNNPEINQQSNMPEENKSQSIASMILGIVSLVLFCWWYISAPCAILAIIFGVLGKKKGGSGMATAGIVLGIITICLWIIMLILGAVGMGMLASMDANELSNIISNSTM